MPFGFLFSPEIIQIKNVLVASSLAARHNEDVLGRREEHNLGRTARLTP